MTKVLAIDFSTTNTGYAFKKNNDIVVGSISGGNSKDPYERTGLIINALIEIIESWGLAEYFIAVEEPIIKFKTKSNITLIRAHGMLLGALLNRFNMGFVDIPNVKWCSYNLITGNREQRKKESIELLKRSDLVPEEAINDDMADAYGILLYSLSELGD